MPSRHVRKPSASSAAATSPTTPSTPSLFASLHVPSTVTLYDCTLCGVECILSLMEFIFSMTFLKEAVMKFYHSLHATSDIPAYNHFLLHLLINAAVMALVTWRLAHRLTLPFGTVVERLGLGWQELLSTRTWGTMTLLVIVLHTLGFAGMVSAW
jgi:hypothetical protein